MADILLNNSGGIAIRNGDIAICNDDTDIIQQARNNINTHIGNNIFHTDIGNPALGERMKYTEQYLDIIEDGCSQAIMCDNRIDSINTISVVLSEDDKKKCIVTFSVITIYGDQLDSQCVVTIGG